MKRRHRISRRGSRRLFKHTARKLHKRNVHRFPMRGGIRM